MSVMEDGAKAMEDDVMVQHDVMVHGVMAHNVKAVDVDNCRYALQHSTALYIGTPQSVHIQIPVECIVQRVNAPVCIVVEYPTPHVHSHSVSDILPPDDSTVHSLLTPTHSAGAVPFHTHSLVIVL